MRRALSYAGWAVAAGLGVVLAGGWQPWTRIVGVLVFLGWLVLIIGSVQKNGPRMRQFLRRKRRAHGSKSN